MRLLLLGFWASLIFSLPAVAQKPSPYCQMATIETGHLVSEDDPLTQQFQHYMNSIASKVKNPDRQDIANKLFNTRKILTDKGKPVGLLRLTKAMDTALGGAGHNGRPKLDLEDMCVMMVRLAVRLDAK